MYPPPCSPKRQGRSEKEITVVSMRYGCNMRLRNALYHWARTSVQKDAAAKKHYAALRKAGHSHGRATRGVADRWLAVLMAMLKAGTLYDPERRGKGQATKVS